MSAIERGQPRASVALPDPDRTILDPKTEKRGPHFASKRLGRHPRYIGVGEFAVFQNPGREEA